MAYFRCGGAPAEVLALPTPTKTTKAAIARFNTDLTENLLHAVAEFSASQASGTPTPSAPIPITGVSAVNFARTGKNLLPNKTYERNAQNVRLGTDNADGRLFYKAGTYTLSLICPLSASLYYSANGTNTNLNATTSGTKRVASFTLAQDTELFFYAYNSGGLTSADISQMQLELGSTATTYEAPTVVTVIINLGGTYYGGTVDAVTSKITLTHKLVTFVGDNSEGWNFDTSGTKARVYTNAVSNIKVSNLNIEGNIISPNASIIAYPDEWKCCVGATGRFIIGVDSTITSKTDWQTYLSNNNLDVKFELETPIVVYASNTAEIPTVVGDNQVFADSGDVEVEYFETVGHKI